MRGTGVGCGSAGGEVGECEESVTKYCWRQQTGCAQAGHQAGGLLERLAETTALDRTTHELCPRMSKRLLDARWVGGMSALAAAPAQARLALLARGTRASPPCWLRRPPPRGALRI